jgi:hypothetical protein
MLSASLFEHVCRFPVNYWPHSPPFGGGETTRPLGRPGAGGDGGSALKPGRVLLPDLKAIKFAKWMRFYSAQEINMSSRLSDETWQVATD